MILELIFAIPPTLSNPIFHRIQVKPPRYSARYLGPAIAIGKKQNLSSNSIPHQINPTYQLQLNSGTLSESSSTNSRMSIKLKEIEQQFGQIDSISTKVKIGSVKSELEFDSEDIKTELTLLSGSGFSFKMKQELQMDSIKPKIEPVIGFKKSFNWFQENTKDEPKDKRLIHRAIRFGVSTNLTLASANLNLPRINPRNEIYKSLEEPLDLMESLNSLSTSNLTTKTTLSLKGDLDDISAKLKFPVPGFFSDELEFKIKNNLPEVVLDDEYQQDDMKSKLSLRYRLALDETTKLEIQSSYNLKTQSRELILMTYLE